MKRKGVFKIETERKHKEQMEEEEVRIPGNELFPTFTSPPSDRRRNERRNTLRLLHS